MHHRTPRILFLAALLGSEAAAVTTLQRLGRVPGFSVPRHDAVQWIAHAPTEDLFAVAARLIGLGLAWWLLAATTLSIARRVVPGCRRLRALDAVTPAALRHALDRALALGIGASLGLASMHAAAAAALDVPVPRVPTTVTPTTVTPTTVNPTSVTPTTVRPTTRAPTATRDKADGDTVVIVRAGDNLWLIARRALRAAEQPADSAAVAPYWQRVVAANRAHLRSHDPNLIFPGERVVLPPNGSAGG